MQLGIINIEVVINNTVRVNDLTDWVYREKK